MLSPGPADELRKVRKRTEFPYPFVEDKGLALAKKLKLQIAANQIQPAIFAVNKKTRNQLGAIRAKRQLLRR